MSRGSSAKPKKALVLLYPENEENEIIVPVTILRRGGIEVTIAGPTKVPVKGSRSMFIVPEIALCDALKLGPWDCVLSAGGQNGWRALSADPDVGKIFREQEKSGRLIASICTSAVALRNHNIMFGRKITSYPAQAIEDMVRAGDKYIYKYDDVVIDGNLISSRGNYTSFHFGLAVLNYLTNRDTTQEVAREMVMELPF